MWHLKLVFTYKQNNYTTLLSIGKKLFAVYSKVHTLETYTQVSKHYNQPYILQ